MIKSLDTQLLPNFNHDNLEFGMVNIIIGENFCGKTFLLENLAKLNNLEFRPVQSYDYGFCKHEQWLQIKPYILDILGADDVVEKNCEKPLLETDYKYWHPFNNLFYKIGDVEKKFTETLDYICSTFYSLLFKNEILFLDNFDNNLNIFLSRYMVERVCELASKFEKQVFIVANNPYSLDGIDLRIKNNKVFVMKTVMHTGKTKIEEHELQLIMESSLPLKMSDKMGRGYIGGLPLHLNL